MRKTAILSTLAARLMTACQSYDTELPMPDDEGALTAVQKEEITQITEDVNSGEVKNILGSLFGKQRKGRSADYTVSLLKDKQGVDRVICINYADNGGFALISAEKTHSPILAYAEEGNFTVTDSLPFPLSEWMDCTMHSIADSESLPADSLEKIAGMWHRYEVVKPFKSIRSRANEVDPDHSKLINLTYEEYLELFHKMKPYMDEWAKDDNIHAYSIDDYTGTTSLGDRFQLAGYVQGVIFPAYADDYWAVTVVREVNYGNKENNGLICGTKWTQDYGYNQSFDLIPGSSTEHYLVGCGPVAIGQLMYGYRYPSFFNWSQMTPYGYGNKVTSDFLLDVFHKCGSTPYYNEERKQYLTKTTIDGMKKALNTYGYTFNLIKGSSINTSIYYDLPAIMIGNLTEVVDGKQLPAPHAWLIERGTRTESYTTIEVWTFTYPDEFKCVYSEIKDYGSSTTFYVNWGWYGNYNGNFALEYMLPNSNYINNSLSTAFLNFSHK